MLRVALYGGSFNPIGRHHMKIASQLLTHTNSDQVWILPAYRSINNKNLASAEHRLSMCNIAVQNNRNPRILVNDFEIKNKLTDPPNEIIKKFLVTHSLVQPHFVMGADNVTNFPKWMNGADAIKLIPFIIIPRAPYQLGTNEWYNKKPHICLVDFPEIPGSSTQFRTEYARHGHSDFVDPDVLQYIKDQQLY